MDFQQISSIYHKLRCVGRFSRILPEGSAVVLTGIWKDDQWLKSMSNSPTLWETVCYHAIEGTLLHQQAWYQMQLKNSPEQQARIEANIKTMRGMQTDKVNKLEALFIQCQKVEDYLRLWLKIKPVHEIKLNQFRGKLRDKIFSMLV